MTKHYRWIEPFHMDDFAFSGAFVIAYGEQSGLLVSRQGTTIALSEDLIECLSNKKCPGMLPLKLVQRGFARIGEIEHDYFDTEPVPRYFVIDLTGKCNYSCIYCFRDDTRTPCSISTERLDAILNYILRYCMENQINRIGIQAWGGEPLLAVDRILKIAAFFRDCPVHASVEVETNASMITPEMAQMLRGAGVRIGVSLDGPERVQNLQRTTKTQDLNSYTQTIQGIQALRRVYGNDFGAICVVTKYSIDAAEELVSYFRDKIEVRHVKFNLVRDNPYARKKDLVPSREQVKLFYEELWDCFLEGWQRGVPLYEGTILARMENLLRASRNNCCESYGCTGGKSILSFDQQGNIFPCEMTDYMEEKIGNLKSGIPLMDAIRANQSSLFHQVRKADACDDCPWWPFCRGGCTSRVHYAGKSGIDEVACTVNQALYPRIAQLIMNNPILAEKMISTYKYR